MRGVRGRNEDSGGKIMLWEQPRRQRKRNSPNESGASLSPRDRRRCHVRPATGVTLPAGPVPDPRTQRTPRSTRCSLSVSVGSRSVTGLLGTVRTLYTNTSRLSTPSSRPPGHALQAPSPSAAVVHPCHRRLQGKVEWVPVTDRFFPASCFRRELARPRSLC